MRIAFAWPPAIRMVVGVLLALALSSCAIRDTAVAQLQAMQRANTGFVDSADSVALDLATRYFSEVKEHLNEQLDRRYFEIKLDIYQQTAERTKETITESQTRLDSALEGTIQRLDGKRQEALDAGNRAAEIDAALALASTLAVLGQERERLAMRAIEAAESQRDAALEELDNGFEAARRDNRLDFDPKDVADALLSSFSSQAMQYRSTADSAYEQLEEFAENVPFAKNAFVAGLKGQQLEALLEQIENTDVAQLIENRGQELLQEGSDFISDHVDSFLGRVRNRLSSSTVMSISSGMTDSSLDARRMLANAQ